MSTPDWSTPYEARTPADRLRSLATIFGGSETPPSTIEAWQAGARALDRESATEFAKVIAPEVLRLSAASNTPETEGFYKLVARRTWALAEALAEEGRNRP